MKRCILEGDHKPLIGYKSHSKSFNLAIATPEHFLSLLYVLALKEKIETISLFNDKTVAGSLAMTPVKIEKE
jgi:4,5-DOPA dioxygenase extradiol